MAMKLGLKFCYWQIKYISKNLFQIYEGQQITSLSLLPIISTVATSASDVLSLPFNLSGKRARGHALHPLSLCSRSMLLWFQLNQKKEAYFPP